MGPWVLLGELLVSARAALAARGLGGVLGAAGIGATIADVLNIDLLRQWAVKIGPRSDAEALEQFARMVMTMTGADGTKVLGPKNPTDWNYFTFSVGGQRAWWSKNYRSFKSVQAAKNFGFRRGVNAGKKEIGTISQAQRG